MQIDTKYFFAFHNQGIPLLFGPERLECRFGSETRGTMPDCQWRPPTNISDSVFSDFPCILISQRQVRLEETQKHDDRAVLRPAVRDDLRVRKR